MKLSIYNIILKNILPIGILIYLCKLIKLMIMSENVIDEKKLKKAAKMFSVVSNPVRMNILDMLAEKQTMNVTQIYTKLNIVQPAASNHLKLLKDSGVVQAKRDAHEIYYSLNNDNIKNLCEVIDKLNSRE